MSPARWMFQHSPNMPVNPAVHPQGWQFKFPNSNGVHYLVQPTSGYMNGKMWSAFRVEKDAAAQIVEVQPCPPSPNVARVRLYFQRRGDDLTAAKEFYRWWSVQTFALNIDTASGMSADLVPEQWSSVLGKGGGSSAAATAGFIQAKADVQAIGITFGGCFAGHGVYVTAGSASFVVSDYGAQ